MCKNLKFIIKKKPSKIACKKLQCNTQILPFRHILEDPSIEGKRLTELIGKEDKFNADLRKNYFRNVNFSGLSMDKGLRNLFWCFHMSGETQVIDRIMTDFGYEYWEQNQNTCKLDKESIYQYSFAIIFLNTDLHQPQMKDREKMTCPQFKKTLTDLLGGEQAILPIEQEVDLIYQSILKTQIIALKSTDLIGEPNISEEKWSFVHHNKYKRQDILSLALPTKYKHIYLQNKEHLMDYASLKISKEIQNIVHENLMYVI